MELMTSRFGSISFGPNEVIRFERGVGELTGDRHWLLLADKAHQSLCWLQSIAHPETALPVISVTEHAADSALSLPSGAVDDPKIDVAAPVIVLHPLVRTADSLSINLVMPIIIDPVSRRAVQVSIDRDHSVQRAPSEQAAPLRQSA